MKPGITIIEVALSILLGSILASALFVSFSQLQKASRIADSFMEVDMRTAVVMRQISQDIMGAFVPQLALIQTATGKSGTERSEEKDKIIPLDSKTVFMVRHKDKQLDMVTCITNNPIAVYDTVKPSVARVVYRLIPHSKHEGAFVLTRQESQDLDLKNFEKKGAQEIRSYELAHFIKSCSCTCVVLDYTEPEKNNEIAETNVKERTLTDWLYEPQKARQEKMPMLPYSLVFKFVFWDDQKHREWPVEFAVPIVAYEPYSEKKKEPKKRQKQPESLPKKPEAPATEGITVSPSIIQKIEQRFGGKK